MNNNITQHVIDSLPVLMAYIGNDEKYKFVNIAYQKFLGLIVHKLSIIKFRMCWVTNVIK
jgi:hypothetical protein